MTHAMLKGFYASLEKLRNRCFILRILLKSEVEKK